jgi:hypothetical protein
MTKLSLALGTLLVTTTRLFADTPLPSPGQSEAPDPNAVDPPPDAPTEGTQPPDPYTDSPAAEERGRGRLELEWGSYEPGPGFKVARTERASMAISAYMLLRGLDQLGNDSYTDHLGQPRPVQRRRDIQLHRAFVFITGFMLDPRLRYNFTLWSMPSVLRSGIMGALTYEVAEAFHLSAGVSALPGIRSLHAVFPFLPGTDWQMAEEFFKPGDTAGVWASGRIAGQLYYTAMLGNSINQSSVTSLQLTRAFAESATLVWMPTTGEFGPREGFGDFEQHEHPATRFGVSVTHSNENRVNQLGAGGPASQTIKLSDGVLAFTQDALAPGVTLQNASLWLVAVDAGIKYRGLHLQGEYYFRRLNRLRADGPLPLSSIFDHGFYLHASYQLVARRFALYAVNSVVFGEFNRPWELGGGGNWYPYENRAMRINAHVNYIVDSPASNPSSYYTAGHTGTILSLAAELMF